MNVRALVAEAVGTALLLATVVGSGIMAESLTHDVALALLANTLATAGMLVALILTFADVSGAHFNPWVTLVSAAAGERRWRDVPALVGAQGGGALTGVAVAHVMFARAVLEVSTHDRGSVAECMSEAVATFALLVVIRGCAHARPAQVPYAVAGAITAGYWFTRSTSFANPAVTVARAFTDSFAGIAPSSVPGFLIGQALGALAAAVLCRWLFPRRDPAA